MIKRLIVKLLNKRRARRILKLIGVAVLLQTAEDGEDFIAVKDVDYNRLSNEITLYTAKGEYDVIVKKRIYMPDYVKDVIMEQGQEIGYKILIRMGALLYHTLEVKDIEELGIEKNEQGSFVMINGKRYEVKVELKQQEDVVQGE